MNSPMRHVDSTRHAGSPVSALRYPSAEAVALNLCAVALAIREHEPVVGVVAGPGGRTASLPCGPYLPSEHASLQAGLRAIIEQQAGIRLAGTQPLGTFGDGVLPPASDLEAPATAAPTLPIVSLCYLALLAPDRCAEATGFTWLSWYDVFPWEDWRHGRPRCLADTIEPALLAWARSGVDVGRATGMLDRQQRVRIAFSIDGSGWDEEKIVERYDLMVEAGLAGDKAPAVLGTPLWHAALGHHARILAAGIAELRRSIKTRPAIFDLMPELFTLFELQKAVEGILGPHLHKQNFRRLVEGEGLVEPTEDFRQRTGGRPARLYRFRRNVLLERATPGMRLKPGRM